MKNLLILAVALMSSSCFAAEIVVPSNFSAAKVCTVDNAYTIYCVDADGQDLFSQQMRKTEGFVPTGPKIERLQIITFMLKNGFQLATTMYKSANGTIIDTYVNAR